MGPPLRRGPARGRLVVRQRGKGRRAGGGSAQEGYMNIVNVGYRSTNYYVLANSVPRLLVDAGWPGTLSTLQHTCKRMDIDLAAIPYQLATHYHPDHAGLVQNLKRLGVRLVVVDTQLAGIPLLRTYVKPQDQYQDIGPDGNIVISTAESRA